MTDVNNEQQRATDYGTRAAQDQPSPEDLIPTTVLHLFSCLVCGSYKAAQPRCRHCQSPTRRPAASTAGHAEESEIVLALNRQALISLMSTHGFTISRHDFDNWRPTERTIAVVGGLVQAEILCTDGVVAWFRRTGDGHIYHAHIQKFEGKISPLYSVTKAGFTSDGSAPTPKVKTAKPKAAPSARKQILDSL